MRVLTPVGEGHLVSRVTAPGVIRRLIVDRTPAGYRIIFFLTSSDDPVTVARWRGGIRTWAQLDSVARWIEKNVPHHVGIELFLEPYSAVDSE